MENDLVPHWIVPGEHRVERRPPVRVLDVNIVVPRPTPRACDVTSFLTKLNRPAGESPRCPS